MNIAKQVTKTKGVNEINTQIFTLPVLTGYVVGNAQTREIAIVCRGNEFFSVANHTGDLILGVGTLLFLILWG